MAAATPHSRACQISLRALLAIVFIAALCFAGAKCHRDRLLQWESKRRELAAFDHVFKIRYSPWVHLLKHDELPLPAENSVGGQPVSWRVVLMRQWEDKMYRYRTDEPWSSPHNQQCYGNEGGMFLVGGDSKAIQGQSTSFFVIVGQDTAFPGSRTVSFDDIRNAPDSTILVLEVRNRGVHWMEPKDIDLSIPADKAALANVPVGTYVLFADGTIGRIARRLPPEVLNSLLTIRGQGKQAYPRAWLIQNGYIEPRYTPWTKEELDADLN